MLAIQGYGSDNSDNEPEESSPSVANEAAGGGFSMALKICSAPDVVPTVCKSLKIIFLLLDN